jgi:hypothetical protein
MPRQDDTYHPFNDSDDTVIVDDTDPNYTYIGRAPRGRVSAAATDGEDEAIWYITRTSVAAPYKTERASSGYNQIWDNRASLTTYV